MPVPRHNDHDRGRSQRPDAGAERVREELTDLLALMVDEPEELEVEAVPMRRATIFEVTAADGDLGKIIGRRGRAARALRTLLDYRGESEGAQYGLEIVD
jgi:predicted RNA-binding protein YlqC (UPF0109 family)